MAMMDKQMSATQREKKSMTVRGVQDKDKSKTGAAKTIVQQQFRSNFRILPLFTSRLNVQQAPVFCVIRVLESKTQDFPRHCGRRVTAAKHLMFFGSHPLGPHLASMPLPTATGNAAYSQTPFS
jgi:hypothetical protein